MEDLSFLDAVASTGCVISLAHKAAMQSSFPLLKKQNKFSKVMFFGKVMGKVGDYLIAVGIEESFLAGKKFFFCTDGVTWAQLPAPTDADAALAAKLPNGLPFTGDISHEFPTPPEPPPPVAEGEEPPEEVEPPKLPEIMRLAVLVNMLDAENAIAPAGALCMLSTGAVKENTAYAGLSSASAGSISSYVFANQLKAKDVLQPSMTNSLDFLTPADAVVPKGALCAHLDESTGVTTIRNLLWPGFVAFSSPAKKWGYCYFGTGEKNADIAFMLP